MLSGMAVPAPRQIKQVPVVIKQLLSHYTAAQPEFKPILIAKTQQK